MGETTCLMQPFSYAACNEEGKNPIHALGQSYSFGRYMSESLAWEKWSTFPHNRYVEEAERYSRPGSVAQKKAFFEAHYKKMAARKKAAEEAALLERSKTVSNNDPELEADVESEITSKPNPPTDIGKNEAVEVQNGVVVATSGEQYNSTVETRKFDNEVVVEDFVEVKLPALNGVDNGSERKVKESEPSRNTQEEKALLKDFSNRDKSLSTSEKKPSLSFSKSLSHGRASKMPSSPAITIPPIRSSEENYATPVSKKSSMGNANASKLPFSSAKFTGPTKSTQKKNDTPISKLSAISPVDKKPTTAKSSHKSINFTSAREITRLTSTIMRKFDSSRIGSYSKPSKDCSTPTTTYCKMSKDCSTPVKTYSKALKICSTPVKTDIKMCKDSSTPARTPVTASLNGEKHQLASPWSETERTRTPYDLSASTSKTRAKWNFLPTDCSKLLSSCRNKSPSPSVSTTPFRLRTEERAVTPSPNVTTPFRLRTEERAVTPSPNVSTPFRLRTEERAVKRKEKLEEKFNANEQQQQQVQQHATLKQRAEYELKRLRPTLCFKARPLPDFYKERGTPNGEMKKVLLTNPQSPKCRRRIASSSDQSVASQPHQLWPSIKKAGCSKQVTEQKSQTSYSFTSRRTKVIHENTSPNIQRR